MEIKKTSSFARRIHEIDLIRGFLILLVIVDHIFINIGQYSAPSRWDNSSLYKFFYVWYHHGAARDFIQPLAIALFCFISGVSSLFSKNNLKRGLITIGVGIGIHGVTHILQLLLDNDVISFFDGYFIIDCNIILVLGICMTLYGLLQNKSNKSILLVILISVLFSSYLIPALKQTLLNIESIDRYQPTYPRPGLNTGSIPDVWIPLFWEPIYSNTGGLSVQLTADFVPLFPFIIAFFVGALFARVFYKNKKSLIPKKGQWEKPICFLGRHTFVIYLAHFIVVTGIFALLDLFI